MERNPTFASQGVRRTRESVSCTATGAYLGEAEPPLSDARNPPLRIAAVALNNPHLRRPVRDVSAFLEKRALETGGLRRIPYALHIVAHRTLLFLRRLLAAASDELTAPQKRTLFELVLNVPVALLAFKDVREWASRFPYFLWIVVLLICIRVAFGIWKRNRVKGVVLQGVAAVQKKTARDH
jgi:hypothetical protein